MFYSMIAWLLCCRAVSGVSVGGGVPKSTPCTIYQEFSLFTSSVSRQLKGKNLFISWITLKFRLIESSSFYNIVLEIFITILLQIICFCCLRNVIAKIGSNFMEKNAFIHLFYCIYVFLELKEQRNMSDEYWPTSRVGNFRQKKNSAEDGISETNGLFWRNSGCSAEQKTLAIPRSEPFRRREISSEFPSMEQK